MKNQLCLFFSILLCIATLFMGVGYASINSVSLNVSGEMIAQVQNGIFITEVKYNEKLSNNVLVTDSRINSSHQTNLDSSIVLTNNADSQITYDIIIYNSNDLAYVFDGVEHTIGENTYSNENITYKLTNLNVGDIVNSKDDINFSITFYYKDNSNISDVELKSLLNFKFSIASYVVDTFDYTGNYEIFTVPHDGIYKIELWGASGGDDKTYTFNAQGHDLTYQERSAEFIGGYGGYTSGEIELSAGTELYVYVGEQGKRNLKTSFNGGGAGAIGGTGYNGQNPDGGSDANGFSGGGATDIRIKSGTWSNFESLKSRIMVAAGGGGATVNLYSSAGQLSQAGGLSGFSGGYYSGHTMVEQNGKGGTQILGGRAATIHFNATGITTDGSFGIGGYTTSISSQTGAGGGGGGYYGGSGASGTLAGGSGQGGGGGSSFISGHNGCDAISKSSTTSNVVHTGQSNHYSGYVFKNTVMIDGYGYLWTTVQSQQTTMPSHNKTLTTTGNLGDGYAKITFISEL